jgi:RNA ligase (TIGR02306 family)
MRKLASVQKIAEVAPIEGADKICKYRINNWWIVDQVGKYNTDDFVIYCEIDSFLPIREEYEFLRKSSYKKLSDGTEGFRIKTIKLRGQVSQGLIIPCNMENPEEGLDIAESLDIIKYEPPIPACLAGKVRGNFPVFVPKTDSERVQNLVEPYNVWTRSDINFYSTEKLDGSSMTCYLMDGQFGVCSRNVDLYETEDNCFWKMARLLDLENGMRKFGNLAIQGELIGENIQGNKYKIKGQRFYVFDIFDIQSYKYLDIDSMLNVCNSLGIETVPILDKQFCLPETIDELLKLAEGKSKLYDIEREGIVIRSWDRNIGFKAISNKFLLGEKD